MEINNYAVDLKDLLNKILTTKVSEQDVIDFIKYITNKETFNNVEENLLILEIYIVLKHNNNFIPLVDFTLNSIPEKIILNSLSTFEKGKKIDKKENLNSSINKQEDDFPIENPRFKTLKEFRDATIECYSPFKKELNPDLTYPAPGEICNLYIEDNILVPGKTYLSEVLIDHVGNIVSFIKGPTEIMENDDYKEIYQGLIGELFKFQEVNND